MLLEPAHTVEPGLGRPIWRACPLVPGEAALALPLLLAIDAGAPTLREWRTRVRAWLGCRRGRPPARGIMTLRSPSGVISALFFHAVETDVAVPPVLHITFLRLIEPAGRYRGLGMVLTTIETIALEHRCAAFLLLTEPASTAWSGMTAGLEYLAPAWGLLRRSDGWFRPLHDARDGPNCRRGSLQGGSGWEIAAAGANRLGL